MNTRSRKEWLWFAAWCLVGAGYALAVLGAFTIGPLVLPLPVLATIGLALYPPARTAVPGVMSGLSLPLFFVAFLNRNGPGTICVSSAGGIDCSDEWSPWPFVVVGIALFVAGVVIMEITRRQVRPPPPPPHAPSGSAAPHPGDNPGG